MTTKSIFRGLLAIAYFVAGIAHIYAPSGFLKITPDWVPHPALVIFITGCCEIAGALGLMIRRYRRAAAIGLALYALCVFPANIKHALENVAIGGVQLSWWYHAPRLALQPVIIWWALWAGDVMHWPFKKNAPC